MIVRLCCEGGAFEVLPEKKVVLDLDTISATYETLISTPTLVIVQLEYEVTCRRDGRLLIKKCKEKDVAKKIASKIYSLATLDRS